MQREVDVALTTGRGECLGRREGRVALPRPDGGLAERPVREAHWRRGAERGEDEVHVVWVQRVYGEAVVHGSVFPASGVTRPNIRGDASSDTLGDSRLRVQGAREWGADAEDQPLYRQRAMEPTKPSLWALPNASLGRGVGLVIWQATVLPSLFASRALSSVVRATGS